MDLTEEEEAGVWRERPEFNLGPHVDVLLTAAGDERQHETSVSVDIYRPKKGRF